MSILSIPRDVQEFLDGYPDIEDDLDAYANYEFYANGARCKPDGRTIEEIHARWFGKYDKLEYKHGYIQWLFPIREHGMNYESQPLQLHEIAKMKADETILTRILESYKLMLDFYGMRLIDRETGLVGRALPPRDYTARYRNLVHSSHNYLRISRILKCLSEMGYEHLNAGFLLHVLNEQSENEELNTRGICSSMDRWWANCIRNQEERLWIREMIHRVRIGEDGYVFTRDMYENVLQMRKETGHLGGLDEDEDEEYTDESASGEGDEADEEEGGTDSEEGRRGGASAT